MKQAIYMSPISPLRIRVREGRLTHVELSDKVWETNENSADEMADVSVMEETFRQLDAYFAGRLHSFDLPLSLVGTPFQERAWEVLRTVPYGKTITYGEEARLMGQPRAARAVGSANHYNPICIIVPCHRVVAAHGLGGYGPGVDRKEYLLRLEAMHASSLRFF